MKADVYTSLSSITRTNVPLGMFRRACYMVSKGEEIDSASLTDTERVACALVLTFVSVPMDLGVVIIWITFEPRVWMANMIEGPHRLQLTHEGLPPFESMHSIHPSRSATRPTSLDLVVYDHGLVRGHGQRLDHVNGREKGLEPVRAHERGRGGRQSRARARGPTRITSPQIMYTIARPIALALSDRGVDLPEDGITSAIEPVHETSVIESLKARSKMESMTIRPATHELAYPSNAKTRACFYSYYR
ncbi:hypothetical protein CERZMDRAFT_102871 [Cercospora zeae-maydis SCOH1-5]|uniref:Uncharacterized protein n=1 Tax=Cercospora zeae-maydis SCOH1-5 TaxID=717836 RepID=A0A6A6EZV7_9PEZI|nr:hypothetical protein CERZMDRAFT_102871 [Cercospora zeae-maydis SCOH1-5]